MENAYLDYRDTARSYSPPQRINATAAYQRRGFYLVRHLLVFEVPKKRDHLRRQIERYLTEILVVLHEFDSGYPPRYGELQRHVTSALAVQYRLNVTILSVTELVLHVNV